MGVKFQVKSGVGGCFDKSWSFRYYRVLKVNEDDRYPG